MQKQSGTDINSGNEASKIAYRYAMDTFSNRQGKAGEIAVKNKGGFSNLLIFGNQRIGIGSDGTGTKAEIAERTGIYRTLGYDLTAMVADDLAAMGFEPTNLSNVIDVDFLDKSIIEELMIGLREACNFAGIAVTGGEIAELGNRIGGYGNRMHFNWSATAIGVLPENLPAAIDGSQIKVGDHIIALKSQGFRSNGFSAVRKILFDHLGEDWHKQPYDSQMTWGEKILTPSLIYAPAVSQIIKKGVELKGIAHITGGGIFDNLQRVLKIVKRGALLETLYQPLPEMLKIQELGKISNEDAYLWWNMGNGMLLVVNQEDSDSILDILEAEGYEAQVAGRIIPEYLIRADFSDFSLEKKY